MNKQEKIGENSLVSFITGCFRFIKSGVVIFFKL